MDLDVPELFQKLEKAKTAPPKSRERQYDSSETASPDEEYLNAYAEALAAADKVMTGKASYFTKIVSLDPAFSYDDTRKDAKKNPPKARSGIARQESSRPSLKTENGGRPLRRSSRIAAKFAQADLDRARKNSRKDPRADATPRAKPKPKPKPKTATEAKKESNAKPKRRRGRT